MHASPVRGTVLVCEIVDDQLLGEGVTAARTQTLAIPSPLLWKTRDRALGHSLASPLKDQRSRPDQ